MLHYVPSQVYFLIGKKLTFKHFLLNVNKFYNTYINYYNTYLINMNLSFL